MGWAMQGLWTIEFGSSAGVYGSGVIVLRDGRLRVETQAIYYDGSYEEPEPTQPISQKI